MNEAEFFATIRTSLFGGSMSQPQVDGIEAILDEWQTKGQSDNRQLAYVLGTVFHETARTMQPIKEMGSQAYLEAKPYYPYFGRGLVQLTWRSNYLHAGTELGLGSKLVDAPDTALQLDIAAGVLVEGMRRGWFTGKKLSDYIHDGVCDFFNARRIVNGLDRAATIKGYSELFLAAINGAVA